MYNYIDTVQQKHTTPDMEFNIKVHSASKSTQLLAWSSILKFIVPAKAHNSWHGVQY
jgi:hypothetical protein